MKIYFKDIVALILILICFYLKLKGIDGSVSVTMALIVGFYFSQRGYDENRTSKA